MKILFISQYFYPEIFKGNDICFDLVKRGNDVTVITAIPNYPQGHFFKSYGFFKRNREVINGVSVIRVPVVPRGSGNSIQLALNYFSYAISASLYTIYIALFKKFDVLFVQQLSPVLMSVPAIIFRKIQKKPLYTWVLDLWPESLESAGGIKNKFALNFFDWFAKWEYENSDKILMSSKSFGKSILKKGDFMDKLIYYPNWAEDVFIANECSKSILALPKGFKVMFAGNIGEAQDFEHIMEAALLLKGNEHIKFIIIGDGRKKDWVNSFIKQHQLENTVFLLGRYPLEVMPALFAQAAVMLVTLKDELIFNLTAPAKIQAYMSSKKAIIGMINGEGASIIRDSKCGFCVKAGDSSGLASLIDKMSLLDNQKLEEMGNNGFLFYKSNFDKKKCLDHLSQIIGQNC